MNNAFKAFKSNQQSLCRHVYTGINTMIIQKYNIIL